MGNLVGAGVKGIIIHALVDAYSPQDDAGMTAVLQNHLRKHLTGGILPGIVTDVLPSR